MKYCTSCGTPNDANTNFCSKCGQSLNQDVNQVNYVPAAQVNGQVYYGKPKNGKATASMVLGIIAVVWSILMLPTIGSMEKLVLDTISEAGGDVTVESAKAAIIIVCCGVNTICGIIGLILGLVAKKNGKAITGIILSSVALVIAIITIIAAVTVNV